MADSRKSFWQEVALILLSYGLLLGWLSWQREESLLRARFAEIRERLHARQKSVAEQASFVASVTETVEALPITEED